MLTILMVLGLKFGKFWLVVGGCGWEILAGCGWLWLVLGGFGWLWVIVDGFGSFLVLVCTKKSTGEDQIPPKLVSLAAAEGRFHA